MAYSEAVTCVSQIAATTFASTDLYKFVVLDAQGHVTLPTATGGIVAYGVLYSDTKTTSTEAEAVTVAIDGIAKVRLAASTLAAGDFIAASTNGLGAAPSTDSYIAGQIVSGSSGSTGRIVSARLNPFALTAAPS